MHHFLTTIFDFLTPLFKIVFIFFVGKIYFNLFFWLNNLEMPYVTLLIPKELNICCCNFSF